MSVLCHYSKELMSGGTGDSQFLNTKSLVSNSGDTFLNCGYNPFYVYLSSFFIRKYLLTTTGARV